MSCIIEINRCCWIINLIWYCNCYIPYVFFYQSCILYLCLIKFIFRIVIICGIVFDNCYLGSIKWFCICSFSVRLFTNTLDWTKALNWTKARNWTCAVDHPAQAQIRGWYIAHHPISYCQNLLHKILKTKRLHKFHGLS